MRTDGHIFDMLDREGWAGAGDAARARMREHAAGCPRCRRALGAALAGAAAVSARAAQVAEPPPFFPTRVMAAVRERRAADVLDVARIWRAARSLVVAMALVVAALSGAAVATSPAGAPGAVAAADPEFDSIVELENSDSAPAEVSDDELVAIMYDGSERAYGGE